jgi:signal peptidase I
MSVPNQPITDLRTRKVHPTATLEPNTPEADNTPEEGVEPEPTVLGVIWETIKYALIAAIIILPIRTFIAQPFVVSGNSMYPTFHNGEYLIVDELSKYIGNYKRGDVVILRYPNDPSKYFIKRVIGLPGETVTVTDGGVSITSATQKTPLVLSEPYVKNPKIDSSARTLDSDEYFVMGDNRAQSSDSRIWGPVPKRLMDGKALLRLFPFTVIALHPGSVESFHVSY